MATGAKTAPLAVEFSQADLEDLIRKVVESIPALRGPEGRVGPKGDPGESVTGPPGRPGERGPKGDPGESVQGPTGPKGDDGAPPTEEVIERAVAKYLARNKAEFKGEKGDRGPAGIGLQGKDGPPGEQGQRGEGVKELRREFEALKEQFDSLVASIEAAK